MTGHELKAFLDDLDWNELEGEVVFCDAARTDDADISFSRLTDVAGNAVKDKHIILFSQRVADVLMKEFGTDEYGMEDDEE